MTVVMAANGYPGSYSEGQPDPRRWTRPGGCPGTIVFHAGTKAEADGTVTAQGGRVLAVTALGADIAEARARAYQAVDRIDRPRASAAGISRCEMTTSDLEAEATRATELLIGKTVAVVRRANERVKSDRVLGWRPPLVDSKTAIELSITGTAEAE